MIYSVTDDSTRTLSASNYDFLDAEITYTLQSGKIYYILLGLTKDDTEPEDDTISYRD